MLKHLRWIKNANLLKAKYNLKYNLLNYILY